MLALSLGARCRMSVSLPWEVAFSFFFDVCNITSDARLSPEYLTTSQKLERNGTVLVFA